MEAALLQSAHQLGQLCVVAEPFPHPGDRHRARRGVERVLHQLSERLARVGLLAGEPADQLERVGRTETAGPHLAPGGPGAWPGRIAHDRAPGAQQVGVRGRRRPGHGRTRRCPSSCVTTTSRTE
jgi:hypothetical protein